MIEFFVEMEPVAQPRQRHRIAGKGDQAFVQNYTPADHPVRAFKQAVHLASCGAVMKLMAAGGMLTGPVELCLTFICRRPRSMKKGPRAWKKTKPDFDNLAKGVCDALNDRVWVDDAQVARTVIEKHVAASGERTGVLVEITPLDEPPGAA